MTSPRDQREALMEREQRGEIIGYHVDAQPHCLSHARQRYGLLTIAPLMEVDRAAPIPHTQQPELRCVICAQPMGIPHTGPLPPIVLFEREDDEGHERITFQPEASDVGTLIVETQDGVIEFSLTEAAWFEIETALHEYFYGKP